MTYDEALETIAHLQTEVAKEPDPEVSGAAHACLSLAAFLVERLRNIETSLAGIERWIDTQ